MDVGGSAPSFPARFYVYFTGFSNGTITIYTSGNVSSITRSSAGVYTINHTTALNGTYQRAYAVNLHGSLLRGYFDGNGATVTAARIFNNSGNFTDGTIGGVAVHG
jgi:hypothetical protein